MQKAIAPYLFLLKDWEQHYLNDGAVETISFKNENLKFIFAEDLREHIINFYVIHPQKTILKVYFRKIYANPNVNIEELSILLGQLEMQSSKEQEEIKIYFQFLIKNRFL